MFSKLEALWHRSGESADERRRGADENYAAQQQRASATGQAPRRGGNPVTFDGMVFGRTPEVPMRQMTAVGEPGQAGAGQAAVAQEDRAGQAVQAAAPAQAPAPRAAARPTRRRRAKPGEPFSPRKLHVYFSARAWTAILSETLTEIRTETGGILLGYREGNDWLVVESIDPGPGSVLQTAFFEYNEKYVTHLANRIAKLYERPLEILGLWHRHPGSFDRFSNTDDGTNATFAQMSRFGAISGLVNIDPEPRFTLYHASSPLAYTRVRFSVVTDDELRAWAPLRSTDELVQVIEQRNAVGGAISPGQSLEVRSAFAPSYLAEKVDQVVGAQAARTPALSDPAARMPWNDAELECAVQLVEQDVAFLSACGVELGLSLSDTGGLALEARGREAEEALGEIVPVRTGRGAIPAFVSARSGSVAPYRPGLIERAMRQ